MPDRVLSIFRSFFLLYFQIERWIGYAASVAKISRGRTGQMGGLGLGLLGELGPGRVTRECGGLEGHQDVGIPQAGQRARSVECQALIEERGFGIFPPFKWTLAAKTTDTERANTSSSVSRIAEVLFAFIFYSPNAKELILPVTL